MNKLISETLKKLTISTMVLIFSFILLAPTADALQYDPDKYKYRIIGDTDPWEEMDIIEPPPGDDEEPEYELFSYKENIDIFIISFNTIFRFNFNFIINDISSEKLTSRKSD